MHLSVIRVLVLCSVVCCAICIHAPFNLKGWKARKLDNKRVVDSMAIAAEHFGGYITKRLTAFQWIEHIPDWDLYRLSFQGVFITRVECECHTDVVWIFNPNQMTVFNTGCIRVSDLPKYHKYETGLPDMPRNYTPNTYRPTYKPPITTKLTYKQPVTTKQTYKPPITKSTYKPPTTTKATYKPPTTMSTYKPPTTTKSTYKPPTTTKSTYKPPTTAKPTYKPPTTTKWTYKPFITPKPVYPTQAPTYGPKSVIDSIYQLFGLQ